MNNNNLSRFDNDGLELVIDTQTGESFATAKGYSRMSGKPYSTIKSRVQKGDENLFLNHPQIPTQGGFQSGTLIPEETIAEWLPKDNPEMATKVMKAGIRVYLHEQKYIIIQKKLNNPIATLYKGS